MRAGVLVALLGLQTAGSVPREAQVLLYPRTMETAAKLLGPPGSIIHQWSENFDGYGTTRVVAEFDRDGAMRRIDLHLAYPISRDSVVRRYGLTGEVARTTIDGRRVEYFLQTQVGLTYAGMRETAGVARLTRYDPGTFMALAIKHPHIRVSRHADARLTGSVLWAYRVDSPEQCERDCGATGECRGYSVAPATPDAPGPVCSLMGLVGEVVRAPGHTAVTYW